MAILDQQDIWAAYEDLFYNKVNVPKDFGITYEAMASVLEEFTARVSEDRGLANLLTKLANGTATYSDLDDFALRMGNHLGNAMYYALPPYAASANGYITAQIADAVIPAGLRSNYDAIVEYATVTQKGLNSRAGLGLNAVAPEYDYNREQGLKDYVIGAPFEDRAKSFRDAVQENGQYYADESAKVNAKAHYNAGLQPVIKRVAAWRCCKWCARLAGTYDYSPGMNREVFQRHSNCNCKVLYDPKDGKGRVQNAHTKKWATEEELAERKNYGLGVNELTPNERLTSIATSRTNGQYPLTYAERGIELPENIKKILPKLRTAGEYISAPAGTFSLNDLRILSTETKTEFAKFIIGGKDYLLNIGALSGNIPDNIIKLLEKEGGIFEAHSHPFIGDIMPSESDIKAFNLLSAITGQNYSQIVSPDGLLSKYNCYGTISVGRLPVVVDTATLEAWLNIFEV